MSDKRKCLFTGEEANYLAVIGHDKQNWAKRVPCTKEWWDNNEDRPLTPNEFKLVELFFEMEVARLKVLNLEERIEKTRTDKPQELPKDGPILTAAEVNRYKPNIELAIELEQALKTKVQEHKETHSFDEYTENEIKNNLYIYIDEPSEPLPPEVFEPIVTKTGTKVLLSTPKDDKVKKVIKKKNLWG